MTYCGKCGCDAGDRNYCPDCGTRLGPAPIQQTTMNDDTGGGLWIALGFVLTWLSVLGGIILCVALFATGRPNNGKAAAIGMALGLATAIILAIAIYAILFASIGAMA